MNSEAIAKKISQSKNYKDIYIKTIERIVNNLSSNYKKESEVEKAAKKILHQIWGAFHLKNFEYSELKEQIKNAKSKDDLKEILRLHSSTNERLNSLDTFYRRIFEITGKPTSIIDIGCGLNPLTIPWMELTNAKYLAYDIDIKEIELFNSSLKDLFTRLSVSVNFEANPGDFLTDSFPEADLVFLFKLIPVIELQEKNSARQRVVKLNAKNIVISFPKKSISGKEKKMKEFYTTWFRKNFDEDKFIISELEFQNEIVFILKNKSQT